MRKETVGSNGNELKKTGTLKLPEVGLQQGNHSRPPPATIERPKESGTHHKEGDVYSSLNHDWVNAQRNCRI